MAASRTLKREFEAVGFFLSGITRRLRRTLKRLRVAIWAEFHAP